LCSIHSFVKDQASGSITFKKGWLMKKLTWFVSSICAFSILASVNRIVAQDINPEDASEKKGLKADRFIVFNAPGATTTEPVGVDGEGRVVGFYFDANADEHGFLRRENGKFVPIVVPGLKLAIPWDINSRGEIIGNGFDAAGMHGFLQTRDGKSVVFDPPGTAFTYANAINVHGTITGSYCGVGHCGAYVRDRGGEITTFDYPGAVWGTFPSSINEKGEIAGFWSDEVQNLHLFLREPDGAIMGLDPPGSVSVGPHVGISDAGELGGSYVDTAQSLKGFFRGRDGVFTRINRRVVVTGMDRDGTVAGSAVNLTGPGTTGFLRFRNGSTKIFQAPNAISTQVEGISHDGDVFGFFSTTPKNNAFVWIRSRHGEKEEEREDRGDD
jgi:hypothetical protein